MGLNKGFLSMLVSKIEWFQFLGEDLFGNENFGDLETIDAYVGAFTEDLGSQDGQGKQEPQKVFTCDLFTDYKGIGPKDKFVVDGEIFYAIEVTTGRDFDGSPLYHEIKASTVPKG